MYNFLGLVDKTRIPIVYEKTKLLVDVLVLLQFRNCGSEKVVEDSVPFYFMSLEQLMNVSFCCFDLPMNGREHREL